jgi:hypothetical protein
MPKLKLLPAFFDCSTRQAHVGCLMSVDRVSSVATLYRGPKWQLVGRTRVAASPETHGPWPVAGGP